MMPVRFAAVSLALVLTVACGPAVFGPARAPQQPTDTQPARTLVIAIRVEPASIAARPLRQEGVGRETTKRLFNAGLALMDHGGSWRPYLAERLPLLNTDSWRLLPDGQMETIYRLKPNLAWHDGTALAAEDFVFALGVYATPQLGQATAPPVALIEEVLAPDSRTVVIRWARPFPHAGTLTDNFPPLPRHLLEGAFQEAEWEAFASHPYWTREFIGLGPYRLAGWEPGSFVEGVAFDGHVLGRPRIQRVKLVFISDPNAALANLLAEEVHLAADDSLRFQQGLVLKREWGPRNGGSVLLKPDLWRATYFQLRPDVVVRRALLDIRVRRALAHSVDRAGLSEALFEGEGLLADALLPPGVPYYPDFEGAIARYPYDLRRAEQLMGEAGFARGQDGWYASGTAGRLSLELKTNASTQNEAEMSIMASGWRQAGFEIGEAVLSAAQARDSQVRASFPALFTNSTSLHEETLAAHTTAGIPRPENRWTGFNRGGWSSLEFDRLSEAFGTTLDRDERSRLIVGMARIFSQELPAISLYFNTTPVAHVAALRGPQPTVPEAWFTWNIQEWELR